MWCANVFALSEKEHFPKELWDVIDPKGESDNPDARKKTLKINTKSARDKLADFDDADEAENEAESRRSKTTSSTKTKTTTWLTTTTPSATSRTARKTTKTAAAEATTMVTGTEIRLRS
jgi:hypothetical protein